MDNTIIHTIPGNKKGEATDKIAGKVKVTYNYKSVLDGTFDSCGSVFVLDAETTIKAFKEVISDLEKKYDDKIKKIEDFIGVTYLPNFGTTTFPNERKYELELIENRAIALNHDLACLKPKVSIYDFTTLNLLLEETSYQVFYNTPSNLTLIPNFSGKVIIYISSN